MINEILETTTLQESIFATPCRYILTYLVYEISQSKASLSKKLYHRVIVEIQNLVNHRLLILTQLPGSTRRFDYQIQKSGLWIQTMYLTKPHNPHENLSGYIQSIFLKKVTFVPLYLHIIQLIQVTLHNKKQLLTNKKQLFTENYFGRVQQHSKFVRLIEIMYSSFVIHPE